MNVLMTILLTVILFAVITLPHELGHFMFAKLFGVRVEEFSFGMGPLLWQRQKGETAFSVRLLPIGGYCMMQGEDEEDDEEEYEEETEDSVKEPLDPSRSFVHKKPYQKIIVLLAGSMMNFLVTILLMTGIFFTLGVPSLVLDEVTQGSPAYEAGLESGDRIESVNGERVSSWSEFSEISGAWTDGTEVTLGVERDGEVLSFVMSPEEDEASGRFVIGITASTEHNLFRAAVYGTRTVWEMNKIMIRSLGELVTGNLGMDDVTGPVGMVQMVSQTAETGILNFLYLTAIISLNLGIMNLIPFPALDGGRILMVILRKFTGERITDHMEAILHLAGMALLLFLALMIAGNDIMRIFGR